MKTDRALSFVMLRGNYSRKLIQYAILLEWEKENYYKKDNLKHLGGACRLETNDPRIHSKQQPVASAL